MAAHESLGEAAASSELTLVARSLLLDRAAALAAAHLSANGIDSILLKGATIATWLYDSGEVRPYTDIDLLVSPSQFPAAKEALAELGYTHRLAGADPAEFGPREEELVGPNNVCIDLHHGLVGVTAATERSWEILAQRTAPFRFADGAAVAMLDLPARAMHLALHAVQNGPIDRKAIADLERGLARVDRVQWTQAAQLADELGASQAFSAGLRLVLTGQALASELSLTQEMTVELALRSASAPQDALFFERLKNTHGLRRKGALIARKVFPTRAFLRESSAIASRGLPGLVWAWVVHPFSLASRLRPALAAWLDARRVARALPCPGQGADRHG